MSGSFDEQLSLLGLVSRIAYFQPDLALRLVDEVLAADEGDGAPVDPVEHHWAASRTDVVHATAPVLQNVAYHLKFLRPALDRLWALAQDDRVPVTSIRNIRFVSSGALRTCVPESRSCTSTP